MKWRRQTLINIVILLASTAISAVLADQILKFLQLPIKHRAVMLLSGSKLYTDDEGVRRYEPLKEVEQAALVNGDLAYRYKYRTNNLGVISKYDYEPHRALDLLIVGDSVTEGQEVGTWTDEIERLLFENYGKTSQNFAIAGNGFVEFERAAVFAHKKLAAKKVLLIFITSDLVRPGDAVLSNQECSTYSIATEYSSINCHSGRPTWFHYDDSLSDARLVAFAQTLQRFGLVQSLRKYAVTAGVAFASKMCRMGVTLHWDTALTDRYTQHCALMAADEVRELSPTLSTPTKGIAKNPELLAYVSSYAIPKYTIQAIMQIMQLYGPENLLMVAIPGGVQSVQATQFGPVMKRVLGESHQAFNFIDISESCNLSGMWAPRPGAGPKRGWGHPTAEGYLKLQECFLSNNQIMKFATQ